jgi:hypothetical protein
MLGVALRCDLQVPSTGFSSGCNSRCAVPADVVDAWVINKCSALEDESARCRTVQNNKHNPCIALHLEGRDALLFDLFMARLRVLCRKSPEVARLVRNPPWLSFFLYVL